MQKKNHNENLVKIKKYHISRKEETNKYERQKIKTDFNFKLICNIKTRINKAFKSQIIEKTKKTIDLGERSQPFFKRRILHQLYGNMTEENYGSVWTSDLFYPLSKNNLSIENGMSKSTYWVNLRPIYLSENSPKGYKTIHLLYLMREVKAK